MQNLTIKTAYSYTKKCALNGLFTEGKMCCRCIVPMSKLIIVIKFMLRSSVFVLHLGAKRDGQ